MELTDVTAVHRNRRTERTKHRYYVFRLVCCLPTPCVWPDVLLNDNVRALRKDLTEYVSAGTSLTLVWHGRATRVVELIIEQEEYVLRARLENMV